MELTWRKASRSAADGACVEVADTRTGAVYVRGSKNRHVGPLAFDHAAWVRFLVDVKVGRYDLS